MTGLLPGEPSSRDSPVGLAERLSALEAKDQRAEATLDQAALRAAEDRSWIARRIIWIFTSVIGVVLLLYSIAGFQTGQWSNAAAQAADLIKSVMLPVVTLVLGFYFGSRSGKG
jgi:hypothetical protein